jgi:Uma2 family endonuclease
VVADRSHPRLVLEDGVPPPWVGQTMTLDAFLKLPEVRPNLEFTDGLVTQKMAAKPTHGSLQLLLASALNQIAGPRRLGIAFPETRFVTPTWAPVPDVAYYRRERIRLRGDQLPADFTEAPDIAIEIVTPGQSVTELIKKCVRYIALGTQIALLVDPDEETVLVFRPDRPLQLLQGADQIVLDDLLPEFDLTVQGMFDALAPNWLNETSFSP